MFNDAGGKGSDVGFNNLTVVPEPGEIALAGHRLRSAGWEPLPLCEKLAWLELKMFFRVARLDERSGRVFCNE